MASDFVEKLHEFLLKKLIEDSGFECIRSRQQSVESEMVEGEIEQQVVEEEQLVVPEERVEEEVKSIVEEEVKVVKPTIFPSPSLRRVLPDKMRRMEDHNKIHVLPDEFNKDINPALIPKIAQTPHQKYIDILAEMVGCNNYRSSLAEFWFLDTLANLLRRAQDDDLNRPTQAILILWFCEWMKEMQQFDAAHRERMLRRFKDNMLAAASFAASKFHIPTPAEAGVYYKAKPHSLPEALNSVRSTPVPDGMEHIVTFEGTAFECCMRDLTKIIHYIFDLFSTDYQFDLVRSVFCSTPGYILIDSPYQIQIPKKMYVPLKAKAKKEKSPKKEGKGKEKGKKKEVDTAEYLALMELKAKDEREVDEQEERDREQYNLRSHILPLVFAATQELFDKYWPPPPPEPDPEPEPETDKKGKKKSGKAE